MPPAARSEAAISSSLWPINRLICHRIHTQRPLFVAKGAPVNPADVLLISVRTLGVAKNCNRFRTYRPRVICRHSTRKPTKFDGYKNSRSAETQVKSAIAVGCFGIHSIDARGRIAGLVGTYSDVSPPFADGKILCAAVNGYGIRMPAEKDVLEKHRIGIVANSSPTGDQPTPKVIILPSNSC